MPKFEAMKNLLRVCFVLPLTATFALCSFISNPGARTEGARNRSVVKLVVDASMNRHQISPYVYGVSHGSENVLRDLAIPVDRWGGNRATRYDWENDDSSTAADWYFQNLKANPDRPEADWQFKDYELFVDRNQRLDVDSLLTISMIGWLPKDDHSIAYAVKKYGPQKDTAPERPNAGNGVRLDGTLITDNDPADANYLTGVTHQKQWVEATVGVFGKASEGGVKFYELDNEPDLWHEIHRDIHPRPITYDELLKLSLEHAKAIKDADPTAMVLGPSVYGWNSYFWSPADGFQEGDDRRAHGDQPLLEWYMQQMAAYEQRTGQRLLDVLDIHFYPEARTGLTHNGQRVVFEGEGDADFDQLKLRSTRALWDPTYVDESWIAEPVRLIPRMQEIIAKNYPGAKLGLSEYRWGEYNSMSSGLAHADVLGIFGREGLFLATFWIAEADTFEETPIHFAFRMYRNYDGNGAKFNDVSVMAASTDQDKVAIYASTNASNDEMTLMLINKTLKLQTPKLSIQNFPSAAVTGIYVYSQNDPKHIVNLSPPNPIPLLGFSQTLDPFSVTLIRLNTVEPVSPLKKRKK